MVSSAIASDKKDPKDLLDKAGEPSRVAVDRHRFYHGKIEVAPKCPVHRLEDLSVWYTPGVAEVCRMIMKDPDQADVLTNRGNTIAVLSDCTRVLGLGNIGPLAGLPVMEGKALLFKYLGGVDAFPICIAETDERRIVEIARALVPSFAGINLEDIQQPKCFAVLAELRRSLGIPVWHDDQQGTATIVTAGVINALKVVGKRKADARVTLIGAGAANIYTARLLAAVGLDVRRMLITDSRGILHPGRRELESAYPEKWDLALRSNSEGRAGGNEEAMRDADVVIAASHPGPGVISGRMVRSMADRAIIFSDANPIPEIWPWEAKEAGAAVIATGRSDFPNQINNSMVFPAMFRGCLDVGATRIEDEMCIAAANELANTAEENGLDQERIVPSMKDPEAFINEAVAVGLKAIEMGLARTVLGRTELKEKVTLRIKGARYQMEVMMRTGLIPAYPV
jgi:malate dehydrogenase (oxaloacetate-decarboxylating)